MCSKQFGKLAPDLRVTAIVIEECSQAPGRPQEIRSVQDDGSNMYLYRSSRKDLLEDPNSLQPRPFKHVDQPFTGLKNLALSAKVPSFRIHHSIRNPC